MAKHSKSTKVGIGSGLKVPKRKKAVKQHTLLPSENNCGTLPKPKLKKLSIVYPPAVQKWNHEKKKLRELHKKVKVGLVQWHELSEEQRRLLVKYYGHGDE